VRRAKARAREAAQSVCATGEQVVGVGTAWGTRIRDGGVLLFLARRQFLIALTNRRLLVFERRARGASGTRRPLVIGKRYEFFSLERVRRGPFLYQVVLRGEDDTRLVFEFRPGQRALGRALVEHLTSPKGRPADAALTPLASSPGASEDAATESFWGTR
jgi:hypothetical protein